MKSQWGIEWQRKRDAYLASLEPVKCAKVNCDRPAVETVRTLGYWEKLCSQHAAEYPYKAHRGWDAAVDLLAHDGVSR